MGQIKDIKLPSVPAGVTAQVLSATLDGNSYIPDTEIGADVTALADIVGVVGKVSFKHAYKIGDKLGDACVTDFDVPAPPVVVPTPASISATVVAEEPPSVAAAPEPPVEEKPAEVPAEPVAETPAEAPAETPAPETPAAPVAPAADSVSK